jgi:hypothetical protein
METIKFIGRIALALTFVLALLAVSIWGSIIIADGPKKYFQDRRSMKFGNALEEARVRREEEKAASGAGEWILLMTNPDGSQEISFRGELESCLNIRNIALPQLRETQAAERLTKRYASMDLECVRN